jgi:hypothetical protein
MRKEKGFNTCLTPNTEYNIYLKLKQGNKY